MNIYADAATNRSKLEHEINVLNAEVANLRAKVARLDDATVSQVVNEWLDEHGIEVEDYTVESLFDALGLEYSGRISTDGVISIRIEGCPVLGGDVDENFVSDIVDHVQQEVENWWRIHYPNSAADVYVNES